MPPAHRMLRILTLRCREASELASLSMDEPLGLADRAAFWGHLLSCAPCRRFRSQLRAIRAALRDHGPEPSPGTDQGEGLSPSAKQRIVAALRDRLANPDDPHPDAT